jgi:hypothetical protein
MQFVIRPAKSSDLNLIRSSWLRSYRREMRDMDPNDYFLFQHERIDRLLASSTTLVAHIEDAPDVVVGWLCCTPSVVHFAWVNRDWQRSGALTQLLAAAGHEGRITCTHVTRDWQRAIKRFRYVPHFLDDWK